MSHAVRELAAALLPDGRELTVRLADASDAATLLAVSHAAFAARPVHGAPAAALSDDEAAVGARLAAGTGYVAEVDGEAVGGAVVVPLEGEPCLTRVGVVPALRGQGVATFLVEVIGEHRADLGEPELTLLARADHPDVVERWRRVGFATDGERAGHLLLRRPLPLVARAADADAMRTLGRRLAGLLRAGDLIIASGELGAGKTTFTQGLGAGLDVDGPIISPTFVLARIHPPRTGGPTLVHVDAYRLGDAAELEDLDLEESLADSVTLVEWGTGVAEGLASDRLDVDIRRGTDPDDETRWVFVTPHGDRWDRARLAAALEEDA
ncbi:tRNA (adenosine(37)-N6)-threonylcarbamoyltransferase complex ATPase subunit type 1 TsaE [Propioniciclava coleopterorum]|nr:tRNA (adenosine(37)-N6)-threonylcarbamoyltransferase complex ATPase subunit type 1 TsaE [Propioniciclava coleopterorum]